MVLFTKCAIVQVYTCWGESDIIKTLVVHNKLDYPFKTHGSMNLYYQTLHLFTFSSL